MQFDMQDTLQNQSDRTIAGAVFRRAVSHMISRQQALLSACRPEASRQRNFSAALHQDYAGAVEPDGGIAFRLFGRVACP